MASSQVRDVMMTKASMTIQNVYVETPDSGFMPPWAISDNEVYPGYVPSEAIDVMNQGLGNAMDGNQTIESLDEEISNANNLDQSSQNDTIEELGQEEDHDIDNEDSEVSDSDDDSSEDSQGDDDYNMFNAKLVPGSSATLSSMFP